jgi:hypothetical protein
LRPQIPMQKALRDMGLPRKYNVIECLLRVSDWRESHSMSDWCICL